MSRKMNDALLLADMVSRANSLLKVSVGDARRYSKKLREIRRSLPPGQSPWTHDEYQVLRENKTESLRSARHAKWILTGRWSARTERGIR